MTERHVSLLNIETIKNSIENLKKAFKSPLARKQLLAILVFSSVITLIDTCVQLSVEFKQDRAFVDFQLEQIGRSHLANLTSSLWELNEEQINAQLNNALTFKDIIYLEIREAGRVSFRSGQKAGPHPYKSLSIPIVYKNDSFTRFLGTLYVEADLRGVYNRLYKRAVLILTAQGVRMLFVSFFILFIIHHLVTRHLITLAGYMRAVDVETFDKPLRLNRKKRSRSDRDELDEVVSTIDNLRRAINYYTEEQDRVEGELRTSERKFRTFAEQAIIGISIVRDGRMIFANEGLSKIIGYSIEEFQTLENDNLLNLFHPDDGYLALDLYKSNMRGIGDTVELRAITKGGQERWLQLFSKPAMSEEGLTIYCIIIDTTERRLVENEMTKFKTITDKANYGASICDPHGFLIYANECFAFMHGYTVEEIIGKHVFTFHKEEQIPRLKELGRILIDKGQYSAELLEHVKKDGVIFPTLMNANLILDKDKNDKPLFYSSTTIDVTELRRLEEQLKHSHKMEAIGTLAGGIAHDFNNILGIILGNAELAVQWIPDASPAYDNLHEIMTASNRAKDVVKQLLNFSRKSDDKKEPNQITFVVKETVNLLRASIPRTIEIKYWEEDDLPMVLANPTQIHQIVINLCTNAAHAMEVNGGTLDIRLSHFIKNGKPVARGHDLPDGSYVCISVKDTGDGIAPDLLDKVFVPYFTTKDTGKGTGMGLAVVHGLVKNHGGEIIVESEVGKGTLIQVFFPAIQASPQKEDSKIPKLPMGRERILFVDDEKALVEVVREILEKFGYKVDSHHNPLNALEHFKTAPHSFDMIITDMSMPHMTGEQLVKHILEIRPDIPVMLCTGYNEDLSEEKALDMGLKAVLNKPVNLRELVTGVRAVLDGH
ncbi:MAG: PAS domain S-box protein [Desulfobacteraceae bacterium]